jgi:hypothetical protein
MLRLGLACLILSCAAIACVSVTAQDAPAEPSMLCQIVANPAGFDGQEVTVRGIFTSDYMHYSSLIDPSCRNGLAPYETRGQIGEDLFDAALCYEEGGLVEVTARGRIESRPGEIPSVKLWVAEYSDPQHVEFDPAWEDRFGVLEDESRTTWNDRRRRMCLIAGFVDPETMQRRERRPLQ